MGILKRKKGLFILLAAAVVCLAVFLIVQRTSSSGGGTYDELVVNGSAELGDEGWMTGAYVNTPGYTVFGVREGEGRNGSNAFYIRNEDLNDARFYQTLAVSPDTLYEISGWIRADSPEGVGTDGKTSKGANLSVEGVYVFSDYVFDTQGEWQQVRLYGRTGEDQDHLTLYVRLGGYSGEALGEAWFDDISVHRVDSAEEGYAVHSFGQKKSDSEEKETAPATGAAGIVAFALLFAVFACFVFRTVYREKDFPGKTALWALAGVLLAALCVRLVSALVCTGYDIDVNDFRGWANTMYEAGPVGFYGAVSWCDYPPGYLLILWVLGFLGHFSGGTSIFLVKLPSILCDLGIILVLYREGKRRLGSSAKALAISALYAFDPLAVCAGAAWGQADSVMTLLLLLVVIFGMEKNWRAALPLYGLAVLVKPQSLMFGPMGLAALALEYRAVSGQEKEKKAFFRSFLTGIGLMAAVMLAVLLPFAFGQGGLKWVFELYGNTLNGYRYATVNACNWYFLFGQNWVGVENQAGILLLLGVFLTLIVPCAVFALRCRRPAKENAFLFGVLGGALAVALVLSAAGEMSFGTLGTLMIVLTLALVLWLYLRGGSADHLPLCGAALLCLMFANGSMMHERYLFPAAALLLAAFLREKDRRILWLFLALSAASFLNVGSVLDRNLRIGGASGHLNAPAFGIQSDLAPLEYLSAGLSVLCAGFSLYLACDRCRPDAPEYSLTLKEEGTQEGQEVQRETWTSRAMDRLTAPAEGRRLDKKDVLIMGCATALFCAFTLCNLGSTKAPQTDFIFQKDQSVVLDLGEEKDFDLLFYQGIHYSDASFTVETSTDGETFLHQSVGGVTAGDCFKWRFLYPDETAHFSGRYLRVTSSATGITLFEIAARDLEGNVLPMTALDGADALCDEKDTLTGDPDWFNSCYFDEIYHARTAYELLHRMTIYEWTHPPLGKVLMSWCVAIFGMTPFGWRFAGAMMGVLMLPAIYLLGRLLTKKRQFAVGAMALLALDFMHFTQTRIATIDSFVVCFILWSFVFMIRWFRRDFWSRSLASSLGDLAASGVFMGLAIASKWTGCYAGVGLAVLFFWGLVRRMLEVTAAKNAPEERQEEDRIRAAKEGKRRLGITVASCFGFFVFVPLLIYYLSYIPFLRANGSLTGSLTGNIRAIIVQCQGMLSYHGTPGLGMDHFFYSPWYEWPLIIKPMWYSSTSYAPEGTTRTILAFGNPAVWYTGALCTVLTAVLWAVRHWNRKEGPTLLSSGKDPVPSLLLISFLAQYLPWVLVPRGTYIYHYFPSVPFIILCNMYILSWLEERRPRAARIILWAELALALAMFIAFFPYISGVTASKTWMDAMKWFPGWLYY